MKIVDEFKEFINRGNVMDLAVGVIIGGAFSKIVSSLVDDIIMPIIGIFVNQNFIDLKIVVRNSEITYGMFIQNVIDFFLIAISIFFMVKLINVFRKKEKEEDAEIESLASEPLEQETLDQEPSMEEVLLTEIRDLLKEQK